MATFYIKYMADNMSGLLPNGVNVYVSGGEQDTAICISKNSVSPVPALASNQAHVSFIMYNNAR